MTTINESINAILRLGETPDEVFTTAGPVLISDKGSISRETYTPEDGSKLTLYQRICLWFSRLNRRMHCSGSFSTKKFTPMFCAAADRPHTFVTELRKKFVTERRALEAADKISNLVEAFHHHLERRRAQEKPFSKEHRELCLRVYHLERARRAFYLIRAAFAPLWHVPLTVPTLVEERIDIWSSSGANNPQLAARILPRPEPRHYDHATDSHKRLASRMTAGLRIDAAFEARLKLQIAHAMRR